MARRSNRLACSPAGPRRRWCIRSLLPSARPVIRRKCSPERRVSVPCLKKLADLYVRQFSFIIVPRSSPYYIHYLVCSPHQITGRVHGGRALRNRIGFEVKIPLDGSRRPVCLSRSRVAHFACGGSQGVSESAGRLKVFLFFCRYEFDRSAWHLNRVQKCSTSQLRLHVDPRGPTSRSVSVHLSKLKYLSRVFYFFGRRPKIGFQRLGPIRVRLRDV